MTRRNKMIIEAQEKAEKMAIVDQILENITQRMNWDCCEVIIDDDGNTVCDDDGRPVYIAPHIDDDGYKCRQLKEYEVYLEIISLIEKKYF